MSLKSIRESYTQLLTTFNDAGIKLSENQKSDVDAFVMAVESSMSKQRESAIRKTKKAVTEKLEKEFKTIFESIMANTAENNNLAAKIQNLQTKIVESRKIAAKVDKYLNLYTESVLPAKMIVDYDRQKKTEAILESLKDLLVVNDDAIQAKKIELAESFKSEKSKCETEVAKIQVKLNESNAKVASLQKELDKLEAVKLLESKTRNLPEFEARSVKKRLAEASVAEINENFKSVLEAVHADIKKAVEEKETTLDEEIKNIINDDDLTEDDVLDNRNHNGHVAESEDDKDDEEICPECGKPESECTCKDVKEVEEEEEFETMESVKFNEDGDIELDESEIIDADLMKLWCNQSVEVR